MTTAAPYHHHHHRTITTADGTPTLYSYEFEQAFHHLSGALLETHQKFIVPAELDWFQQTQLNTLRFLDVCMGLGYETMATYQLTDQLGLRCQSVGLDISAAPLRHALSHPEYCALWPPKLVRRAQALRDNGTWQDPLAGDGDVIWQDARDTATQLVKAQHKFHLIYLDAFSAQVCPELWSLDFLAQLVQLLEPGGRLITYSRSAALRRALRDLQCELYSTCLPHHSTSTTTTATAWSYGTVAVAHTTTPLWQSPASGLSRPTAPYQPLSLMNKSTCKPKVVFHIAIPRSKPPKLQFSPKEPEPKLNLTSPHHGSGARSGNSTNSSPISPTYSGTQPL